MRLTKILLSHRPRAYRRSGLTLLCFVLSLGWLGAQGSGVPASRPDTTAPAPPTTIAGEMAMPILDTSLLSPALKRRYLKLYRQQQGRGSFKGNWQVTASLGVGSTSDKDYRNYTYTRTATPGNGRSFILPSGEIVFTERSASFRNGRDQDLTSATTLYPRLGVARQTRRGWYFHASTGYYYNRLQLKGDNPYVGLNDDEVQLVVTSREDAVSLEFGIQYTFMRSRRFRPFLGAGLFSTLYYRGEERWDFYDANTRQQGVFRGFRSEEFFPIYPELGLTAGFQFAVTERVSVGAQLFSNGGSNVYYDAPFGAEVRYALK
ncbi:hypothetical protein [Neolewinella antarctica]|uniref:Outer membrane protein beta-barrel domain-containing protein n=1 Tax=Neolewinella antarctica TaxID=442734 RepID=A0ABX0XBY9_9BACT|nr:hypothetical protein [Neolewinella antarctica]NJC26737.1 hypothetical protein [Neolewinella antarctica]